MFGESSGIIMQSGKENRKWKFVGELYDKFKQICSFDVTTTMLLDFECMVEENDYNFLLFCVKDRSNIK